MGRLLHDPGSLGPPSSSLALFPTGRSSGMGNRVPLAYTFTLPMLKIYVVSHPLFHFVCVRRYLNKRTHQDLGRTLARVVSSNIPREEESTEGSRSTINPNEGIGFCEKRMRENIQMIQGKSSEIIKLLFKIKI